MSESIFRSQAPLPLPLHHAALADFFAYFAMTSN